MNCTLAWGGGGVCWVSLKNEQGDEQVELWPKWDLEAGTNQLYTFAGRWGTPDQHHRKQISFFISLFFFFSLINLSLIVYSIANFVCSTATVEWDLRTS